LAISAAVAVFRSTDPASPTIDTAESINPSNNDFMKDLLRGG
jgi:hypothetical protein